MRIITFLSIVLLFICSTLRAQTTREISMADFREKVRGAWAGKMIGVAYGAPTEFKFQGKIIPLDSLPEWKPEMVRAALRQDDLYVQMTFADALDTKGLGATTADYGEAFKASKYPLWHASQSARRNLRRGVSAEDTGTPTYNAHGEDIAFQIVGDYIGLASPAMPVSAAELSDRASRLEAWGDGMCAGRFVGGMYAKAFFETNARKIVEAGLACVPPESTYAQAIRHVLDLHQKDPINWEKTWQVITDKWGSDDRCPYGALAPLSIDAKLNGAYVAIGMLYGGDDFTKVLEISTRCGQDSDCNPCTACGVWAAARGYAAIPAKYTQDIPSIASEKFVFTNSSFDSTVDATTKRAILIAQAAGGRMEGDRLILAEQSPKATPVRDFPNLGKVAERILADDPRWTWAGEWKPYVTKKSGMEKIATEKGAEASIKFTGTGAIIVGPYVGAGGQADIYLDGKLDRTVDVWPDMDRRVILENVWHKFGLPDGEHTIRVVVRGEKYGESTGTEIRIQSLVVFR